VLLAQLRKLTQRFSGVCCSRSGVRYSRGCAHVCAALHWRVLLA
jgi:hypothetical protein